MSNSGETLVKGFRLEIWDRKNMSTKLFVGSLSYSVNEGDLRELFSEAGKVVSANVISDRENGNSRGFGFVEMSSSDEAQAAIKLLNGKKVSDRELIVNIAKPQIDRKQKFSFDHKR